MRTRHPPQGGEPDFVRTGTAMTCYMTQKPLYGASWPNLETGPLGYLFTKRYLNGCTLLQNHTRACQGKLLATVCSWRPHATGEDTSCGRALPERRMTAENPFLLQCFSSALYGPSLALCQKQRKKIEGAQISFPELTRGTMLRGQI